VKLLTGPLVQPHRPAARVHEIPGIGEDQLVEIRLTAEQMGAAYGYPLAHQFGVFIKKKLYKRIPNLPSAAIYEAIEKRLRSSFQLSCCMIRAGGRLMAKRRKKRPSSRKRMQQGPIVGIAWYTPDQWDRLKLVADDSDALDDTHKDWLKNASGRLREFKQKGYQVVKVSIDIDEWVAWCQENGKVLNGAARSEFTSEKVSERFRESSSPDQYLSRQINARRNPIPLLDTLETLFETERDKSIPPPYPFDQVHNTIRLPQEIEAQLQQLARTGHKVEAIKQVTQLTGAGLRVAKDYVDGLVP
jgi:hypothetical protein